MEKKHCDTESPRTEAKSVNGLKMNESLKNIAFGKRLKWLEIGMVQGIKNYMREGPKKGTDKCR